MEALSSLRWSERVRVFRSCDDDRVLAELESGRDLLVDIPRRWGDTLPHGLLLDDLLSQSTRTSLDGEAIAALASWRQVRDRQLTLDGACLSHIWDQELLAEVFMTETRIVSGLRRILVDSGVRRVELDGFDRERADCLRQVLAEAGITVVLVGEPAAAPAYPGARAAPWRISLRAQAAAAILRLAGVPASVRGAVYVIPYWHLLPVIDALAQTTRYRPVLDPWRLPGMDIGKLARTARRGGWIGSPGGRALRRSRRRAEGAIAAARSSAPRLDAVSALLDDRALAMLDQRAGDTLAIVERLRESFGSGRIRVAVLPYDSPPDARAVLTAAHGTGVVTLVVQHGFHNESNNADKTLAEAVAVWSEADVRELGDRTQARLMCTGNPGIDAAQTTGGARRRTPTRHTLVLVEYGSRLSTRIDNRISMRHVRTALEGLERARPGTAVTIRPHPAEHEPVIFSQLASAYPRIKVSVDSQSSIAALIAASDLCIAAVSTAALEAAAGGVPVILLNVTGLRARAPFDGSSGLPVATDSGELARHVSVVLESPDVPGQQQMLEALGVKVNALQSVLEFISDLAEAPEHARTITA